MEPEIGAQASVRIQEDGTQNQHGVGDNDKDSLDYLNSLLCPPQPILLYFRSHQKQEGSFCVLPLFPMAELRGGKDHSMLLTDLQS